jgi:hypothetical protein
MLLLRRTLVLRQASQKVKSQNECHASFNVSPFTFADLFSERTRHAFTKVPAVEECDATKVP